MRSSRTSGVLPMAEMMSGWINGVVVDAVAVMARLGGEPSPFRAARGRRVEAGAPRLVAIVAYGGLLAVGYWQLGVGMFWLKYPGVGETNSQSSTANSPPCAEPFASIPANYHPFRGRGNRCHPSSR